MLTIALLNSAVVTAQDNNEYLTRLQAAEEIIKTLYLSGGETNFSFENDYFTDTGNGGYIRFEPNEELLQGGYPILCELYAEADGCAFSDISEENGNLSEFTILAGAMGVVKGFDDNTFRPDNYVTYNEAVTMVVRSFTFGRLTDFYTYPEDYITAAIGIGIVPDNGANRNEAISSRNFRDILDVAKTKGYYKSLMEMFIPPTTAYECVLTYAEACMNRNGAMQYALFDDELKAVTRDSFESFNWVTGMSSPYISEFEIVETGELEYDIIFQTATSTGPGNKYTTKLLLRKMDGRYYINEQ